MIKRTMFFTLIAVLFFLPCCKNTDGNLTILRYGLINDSVSESIVSLDTLSLDPLKPSNNVQGRGILFNIFEGLVKPDTQGGLCPCIAESWEIKQDGTEYHFKLREGVRFHDGTLLGTRDVLFSLNAARTAGFPGFEQIDRIEALGNSLVIITLKEPDFEFLPFLAIGIVKAGNTRREKKVIGTGPYALEKYSVGKSLVLRRFADYWQWAGQDFKKPTNWNPEDDWNNSQKYVAVLDKINIEFINSYESLAYNLFLGKLDGATLNNKWIQVLNPDAYDFNPCYSAAVQMLAMNNALEPLDDIAVRQAICYSIFVSDILDIVFYSRGKASASPLTPGLKQYYNEDLAIYYYDPDKVRSMLSQAGYGPGLKEFTLEISVRSDSDDDVDTAYVIADALGKNGINAVIKELEPKDWQLQVLQNRNFQAAVLSLDAFNVSPRSFLSRYVSESNDNFINYRSPDYDRICAEALLEIDEDKRIELYKQAQKIIVEDAASFYIQDILHFKTLKGWTYGGVLNYPLNVIDFASMFKIQNYY